jgi:hypothetical protein
MPMRVVSRKSKPMRVGLRTVILRLRMPMEDILFYCPLKKIASINSDLSFEA